MRRMGAKIIRHRLGFLVGVLVTAIVLAVLLQADIPVVSVVCAALLALLTVGFAVSSIVAYTARRPTAFLIHEGTFAAPPIVGAVLSSGMFTGLAVQSWTWVADHAHQDLGYNAPQVAAAVFISLLLPVQWYSTLGRFGLVLRPDGLLDRQPLGSIFVPWEAGPAAHPTRLGVKLRLTRPDLVVRSGLRPGTSIATGTDPGCTAWAINLYTARPDYRPTIGTHGGLRIFGDR
jgi:hypothetical protein